jgi:hypothetical protein
MTRTTKQESLYVRSKSEEIMTDKATDRILEEICATIEIPDSSYETAEARYQDLGRWFGRPESVCSAFHPHICAQGSFRLGTVNRPLNEKEPYDLDSVCNLEQGVDKSAFTQEELKQLVGQEIESYRVARRIEEEIKEKHRCWRLEYADAMRFHMDILPCIPEVLGRRSALREAMVRAGSPNELAQSVANLAVSITDDRHPSYRVVNGNWFVSNPVGFAQWFESRMKLATMLLEKRLLEARASKIDDLPVFRWKTPLQRTVQLLKRHRDIMFSGNCELKPVSNILTTLAGLAYRGESSLGETLATCLKDMDGFVNAVSPRVPNPVNPVEDFADKWGSAEGRSLRLEENFWRWLAQAKADFASIGSSTDADFITEQALRKLGARIDSGELLRKVGFGTPLVRTSPRIEKITEAPPRPWRS